MLKSTETNGNDHHFLPDPKGGPGWSLGAGLNYEYEPPGDRANENDAQLDGRAALTLTLAQQQLQRERQLLAADQALFAEQQSELAKLRAENAQLRKKAVA